MRCAGSLHWLHSASTDRLTFFGIHLDRGTTAMNEFGILPSYRGVAVHDHWKSYFKFEDCLLALHRQVKLAKLGAKTTLSRQAKRKFLRNYEKLLRSGLRHHATHDPLFAPRSAITRASKISA